LRIGLVHRDIGDRRVRWIDTPLSQSLAQPLPGWAVTLTHQTRRPKKVFGLDPELGAQDLSLWREVSVIDRLVRFGDPQVACVGVGADALDFLLDPYLAEVVLNLEPELGFIDGLGLALGPHHHGLAEALCAAQPNPVSSVAQVSAPT
jgi:hypothetical protein